MRHHLPVALLTFLSVASLLLIGPSVACPDETVSQIRAIIDWSRQQRDQSLQQAFDVWRTAVRNLAHDLVATLGLNERGPRFSMLTAQQQAHVYTNGVWEQVALRVRRENSEIARLETDRVYAVLADLEATEAEKAPAQRIALVMISSWWEWEVRLQGATYLHCYTIYGALKRLDEEVTAAWEDEAADAAAVRQLAAEAGENLVEGVAEVIEGLRADAAATQLRWSGVAERLAQVIGKVDRRHERMAD